VVEPDPPRFADPEPDRPMVWPASWGVQTARSFVEADTDESTETTHRFPGVETARSFVEAEPAEVEFDPLAEEEAGLPGQTRESTPVFEPDETDQDEEDLVAEAEPVIEPTETAD
jgi:hypothetical protein